MSSGTPGCYSAADPVFTYTWLREGVATWDDAGLPSRSSAQGNVSFEVAVGLNVQRLRYTSARCSTLMR